MIKSSKDYFGISKIYFPFISYLCCFLCNLTVKSQLLLQRHVASLFLVAIYKSKFLPLNWVDHSTRRNSPYTGRINNDRQVQTKCVFRVLWRRILICTSSWDLRRKIPSNSVPRVDFFHSSPIINLYDIKTNRLGSSQWRKDCNSASSIPIE